MHTGLKGKKELIVRAEDTAKAVGSGGLKVFATPSMLALMEATAMESVASHLEEGQGTVGTMAQISHTAATPVGMRVTCESELTAIDGRKLTFATRCFDEKGSIGEAMHERFIIDNARFMQKAQAKLDG